MYEFIVIDKTTGKEADMEQIVRSETWAGRLAYWDMEQFCLGADGTLYLLDECGNYVYCPSNRFIIKFIDKE